MVTFQDRVPTYPGRVHLAAVPGQADTYDLTRADEPIVEGTKINAALFEGLMPGEVGDILISTRTDLGDNWLLCNGEAVDGAEYPELDSLLKVGLETPNGEINTTNTLTGTAYGNGYWVVVISSDKNVYYTASFTPDLSSWSKVSIGFYPSGVKFLSGRFCVYGGYSDGSYTYPRIAYANTPAETWQTVTSVLKPRGDVSKLWCEGGMWYAYQYDSSESKGGMASWGYSTDGYTWTMVASNYLNYSPQNNPTSFAYGNGVWLKSHPTDADGATLSCALLRSTNGINWSSVTKPRGYKRLLLLWDGKQFVGLGYSGNSPYTYYLLTSNDGITWVDKVVSGMSTYDPLLLVDGIYILGNAIGTDLVMNEYLQVTYNGAAIKYSDKYGYDGSVFCSNGYYCSGKRLPMISTAGAYTYIKAKED